VVVPASPRQARGPEASDGMEWKSTYQRGLGERDRQQRAALATRVLDIHGASGEYLTENPASLMAGCQFLHGQPGKSSLTHGFNRNLPTLEEQYRHLSVMWQMALSRAGIGHPPTLAHGWPHGASRTSTILELRR
jgi:hypothetical protein